MCDVLDGGGVSGSSLYSLCFRAGCLELLFFHLNISWAFPFLFRELISGWWIRDLDGLLSTIWAYLLRVIYWCLWNERNSRIFDGDSRSYEQLLVHIHNTLLEWIFIRSDFVEREWASIWNE